MFQVASREYFNDYGLLYGHIVIALDQSKRGFHVPVFQDSHVLETM